MLTNAIDQVLIEGPPLEAGHGKRLVAVAMLMTRLELGEGHGTQTGIEVEIEFVFGAGLAIAQTSELLGIAKKKLNGMITNDNFCGTRWGQLPLSWWRRPLRLRRASDHDLMCEP